MYDDVKVDRVNFLEAVWSFSQKRKETKRLATDTTALQTLAVFSVSGLFRTCWLTWKQEYSVDAVDVKRVIWNPVLIRMWTSIGGVRETNGYCAWMKMLSSWTRKMTEKWNLTPHRLTPQWHNPRMSTQGRRRQLQVTIVMSILNRT